MTLWKWSQTAAANATADASINWAEGQAPSSVNDSARAMMAAVSKYRDDIAGAITTAGSSSAYFVTSYQGFDTLAHMHQQMIAFVPHTTSAGSAGQQITLNVDGLGAKPIRFAPSVEIPSGTLVQGTPYVVTYNNGDGAFYLQGVAGNPYSIPLGAMLPYTGTTAPNSAFVLPFGQAISRTTYATYFSLVGTAYGAGDGSTTFNVLDMRGRAPFGQDNMGGSAANRITVAGGNWDGTQNGGAGGAQNRTLSTSQVPNLNVSVSGTPSGSVSISDTRTYGVPANLSGTVGPNQLSPGNNLGGNTTIPANLTGGSISGSFSGNSLTGTGNTTNGGGGSHPTMPPAVTIPYILRVI
jgi:microcystin-dependent protein